MAITLSLTPASPLRLWRRWWRRGLIACKEGSSGNWQRMPPSGARPLSLLPLPYTSTNHPREAAKKCPPVASLFLPLLCTPNALPTAYPQPCLSKPIRNHHTKNFLGNPWALPSKPIIWYTHCVYQIPTLKTPAFVTTGDKG